MISIIEGLFPVDPVKETLNDQLSHQAIIDTTTIIYRFGIENWTRALEDLLTQKPVIDMNNGIFVQGRSTENKTTKELVSSIYLTDTTNDEFLHVRFENGALKHLTQGYDYFPNPYVSNTDNSHAIVVIKSNNAYFDVGRKIEREVTDDFGNIIDITRENRCQGAIKTAVHRHPLFINGPTIYQQAITAKQTNQK